MFQYLTAAFGWRWNLLALAGGVGAALLSPYPDVVLALLAAAELTYLTGLLASDRFRKAIDAKVSGYTSNTDQQLPTRTGTTPELQMAAILRELGPGPRNRFLALKERCESMLKIARGINPQHGLTGNSRNEGLDKLLWVFLRMLSAQQGLWKFLDEANDRALEQQVASLERRRKEVGDSDERMSRTLTDAIATAQMRMDNIRNARRNAEFISLELDRIENKILAIGEMAVNNQQPDFISAQVDAVAHTMAETEHAMKELDYLSGISRELSSAPPKIMQLN
jgi:hypothetical protein